MKKEALAAGVDVREYWSYTLGELLDTIDAYRDREELQMKSNAAMLYKLADLAGMSFGRFLSSKNKFPQAHEAFPGVLEEPKAPLDWRVYKKRMLGYIAAKKGVSSGDG